MVKDAPILTAEAIGPKQSLTPEGFLLCQDVPIARTGVMIYGADEVPVEPGPDGVVYVTRPEDEVFSPEAMASFEGKPVTNLHPPALVTPDSFREFVVGSVHNVRREGSRLVADLLVADASAIEAIQQGLREVSCGYDASYDQTSPGQAIQRNIVGNHVALVPKGRCGPSCSISDSQPQEIPPMKKTSVKDKILSLFKTKDQEGLEKILDEMEEPSGEVHIHLAPSSSEKGETDGEEMSLAELTKAVRDLIKDKESRDKAKDEAEEKKKKDEEEAGRESNEEENREDPDRESYSGDALPVLKSRAEILSPGIKLSFPTGDSSQKSFRDAVIACKRQALKAAYATDEGRLAVDSILSGRCIDKLSPSTLDAVFMGASALIGAKNNLGGGSGSKRTTKDFGKHPSIAEINKANREFWAARSASK